MKELRKNRKGFTLVELLAVIVILALIMSIAVVSMGGIMQSAREGTFKDTAISIIDGVKTQLSINGEIATTGNTYYFFQEQMLDKGGHDAPLGGTIQYIANPGTDNKVAAYVGGEANVSVTKIGNMGVYKVTGDTTLSCTVNGITQGDNVNTSYSFIEVGYNTSTKISTYTICLTAGDSQPYIYASLSDLTSKNTNKTVIYGI